LCGGKEDYTSISFSASTSISLDCFIGGYERKLETRSFKRSNVVFNKHILLTASNSTLDDIEVYDQIYFPQLKKMRIYEITGVIKRAEMNPSIETHVKSFFRHTCRNKYIVHALSKLL
jgi:hypothetical protein